VQDHTDWLELCCAALYRAGFTGQRQNETAFGYHNNSFAVFFFFRKMPIISSSPLVTAFYFSFTKISNLKKHCQIFHLK